MSKFLLKMGLISNRKQYTTKEQENVQQDITTLSVRNFLIKPVCSIFSLFFFTIYNLYPFEDKFENDNNNNY